MSTRPERLAENARHAPGPSLFRRRTGWPRQHCPAHRGTARQGLHRRWRAPTLRHPQHDPAARRRHLPRDRRGARPPAPPTRPRSARPSAPAPPSAAAGSAGSSRSTTSRSSRRGSAARPRRATGTAPTATELRWKQIGVNGLIADPQLPFFIEWESPAELHPEHRRRPATSPWPAWRSPATRSASASGSARPSRHRWRTSRSSGSPPTAPPASSPRRSRRPTGSSGLTSSVRAARRRPEPQHLAPPRDVRDREPRRRPRRRDRGRDARRSRRGPAHRARRRLRHRLPPAAVRRDRGVGDRRRAARRPGRRWPAGAPAGCRTSTVLPGTAQALPLPDASVDVVHARWAYFFGPGCEPGLAELDRVVRRGGTAFVIDNDPTRSTFGAWFRRGYPDGGPGRGRAVLVDPRLDPDPGRHALVVPSRADLEAVVRIEFTADGRRRRARRARGHRGRLRRQPLVAALLTPRRWRTSSDRRSVRTTAHASVGVSSTPGPTAAGARAGPRAP